MSQYLRPDESRTVHDQAPMLMPMAKTMTTPQSQMLTTVAVGVALIVQAGYYM
jgi:hypothetical protein